MLSRRNESDKVVAKLDDIEIVFCTIQLPKKQRKNGNVGVLELIGIICLLNLAR